MLTSDDNDWSKPWKITFVLGPHADVSLLASRCLSVSHNFKDVTYNIKSYLYVSCLQKAYRWRICEFFSLLFLSSLQLHQLVWLIEIQRAAAYLSGWNSQTDRCWQRSRSMHSIVLSCPCREITHFSKLGSVVTHMPVSLTRVFGLLHVYIQIFLWTLPMSCSAFTRHSRSLGANWFALMIN